MATEKAIDRAIVPARESRAGTATDRQGREWKIQSVNGKQITLTRSTGTQYGNVDSLLSMGWVFHFAGEQA